MPDLRDAPPEIHARLKRLIDAHHPYLQAARIEVLVRDTAQMGDGIVTFAEVDTADNAGEQRQFDFTMWFALDAWASLDEKQRDALMDHECHHCGWDEAGKPILLAHDINEFDAVLAYYGLWWPGAEGTRAAIDSLTAPSGPEGAK